MNKIHPHEMLEQQSPFLFIDKICEREKNKIHCIKNLSYNEPYFLGHFPKNPILPGVLMIEMAAQASMIMVQNISEPFEKKTRGYLVRVNNVKYYNTAIPGDRLDIKVELKEKLGNYFTTRFTLEKVDESINVAKGELVFYIEEHIAPQEA